MCFDMVNHKAFHPEFCTDWDRTTTPSYHARESLFHHANSGDTTPNYYTDSTEGSELL